MPRVRETVSPLDGSVEGLAVGLDDHPLGLRLRTGRAIKGAIRSSSVSGAILPLDQGPMAGKCRFCCKSPGGASAASALTRRRNLNSSRCRCEELREYFELSRLGLGILSSVNAALNVTQATDRLLQQNLPLAEIWGVARGLRET